MCRKDIIWECECVEHQDLKSCIKRKELRCTVEKMYPLTRCRPHRLDHLYEQAEILYQRLSDHDKDMYDDYDKISAEDWNSGKWKWEWENGEWRRRRIPRPQKLRYIYEARYADERAAKYEEFLDRNPQLRRSKFKYPRPWDTDWDLDQIVGPPLTIPYITVGESGLGYEEE